MCFYRIFIKKPDARELVRPALMFHLVAGFVVQKNRVVNRKGIEYFM
jgi:hypothetical protein